MIYRMIVNFCTRFHLKKNFWLSIDGKGKFGFKCFSSFTFLPEGRRDACFSILVS